MAGSIANLRPLEVPATHSHGTAEGLPEDGQSQEGRDGSSQASYTVRGGLGALPVAFENWPGVGAPSLWCIAHLAGLLMASLC